MNRNALLVKLLILGLVVFVSLGLAACAEQEQPAAPPAEQPGENAEERELTIGIVTLQMRSAYFIAMVRAIEEAAGEYANVKTVVADADGDAAKVGSDIEDLIALGVDGLIMNISPLETLPGPMQDITEAGIPCVLVNRRFLGTGYDSWIGVDNYETGVAVGEQIVRYMDGSGVLLMMRGGPEDNSTGNARRDGVLSQVEPAGIEVIFAPEFGGWTEDGGFSVMEDMLALYPNIDALFAENDSMALGAQKAIEDAGRADEILIFGFDGQKAALSQIMEGTNYIASGLNSPDLIGPMGFNHLMAVIAGAVRKDIDTMFPVTVITPDNIVMFYDPDSIF